MSDNQFPSIGRVERDPINWPERPGVEPGTTARTAKSQHAEGMAGVLKENEARDQAIDPDPRVEKPASTQSDLSLKFRVDEKTKDITILLIDRASQKVVRTIPPEEINKMKPGELLELFA